MNPSPGLSLVGAVVITDLPLEMEPHAPGFPAPTGLPSVPVAGYRVPADGLLNLGLGLRIDDPTAYQGFEGVLIDYALDGRHYRATLAYRSVLRRTGAADGARRAARTPPRGRVRSDPS